MSAGAMISRAILRIQPGPLRAALWMAWFPVVLVDIAIAALGINRRMLAFAAVVFWKGIDGAE